MANSSVPESGRKSDWILTQNAFRKLLQWFDSDENSEGANYLEIRRRLVSYFDRKGCSSPEELADETLNRVARRLEEEGSITTDAPARYCYIVARFVLLEWLRVKKKHESLDEQQAMLIAESDHHKQDVEKRSEHLERCMRNLTDEERTLIVGYYQGEQRIKIDNRRKIAEKLGVSMNALSIRACRIRDKLESCMSRLINAV